MTPWGQGLIIGLILGSIIGGLFWTAVTLAFFRDEDE